jgi:hypothetical protein
VVVLCVKYARSWIAVIRPSVRESFLCCRCHLIDTFSTLFILTGIFHAVLSVFGNYVGIKLLLLLLLIVAAAAAAVVVVVVSAARKRTVKNSH